MLACSNSQAAGTALAETSNGDQAAAAAKAAATAYSKGDRQGAVWADCSCIFHWIPEATCCMQHIGSL